jgi:hypothetical protein
MIILMQNEVAVEIVKLLDASLASSHIDVGK